MLLARTRFARHAVALVAIFALQGCSESKPSSASAAESAATQASSPAGASTPNVRPTDAPAATKATTQTPDVSAQTGVESQIIDTPPEVLAAGTSKVPLATDYKPAPTDRSIVLTAAVPSVTIYDSETSLTPKLTMANPIKSGAPLTFLVDGMTSTRYKVLLPIRPNGSTGWVDPAEVTVEAHRFKIVVELGAHNITVTNGDDVIMSEKIGVGKDSTPTPNGRYYIRELVKPCYSQPGEEKCVRKDDGLYGPFAYGLSGFSSTLKNLNGRGQGQIGIHGTDREDLIGTDVSAGCIRMKNDAITQLSKILPLGTPVIVKA
jgi:lipoprotein-anchoring transpeptidase ErfK/SrfK